MRPFVILPAALTAATVPGLALAHAGDHSALPEGTLAHALGAPDHALALFFATVLPLGLWAWLRGRG